MTATVSTPAARPRFRELFDAHVDYVWNTLRRFGIPDAERDDVTQEVFLAVHDLLEDYDATRPFRPWLFAIAYRVALRHRRRVGRRAEDVSEPAALADRVVTRDESSARDARELVLRAVEAIEIHRRAVFVMKELDGHDVPEIAEALGIPLNTAYTRLRLARDEFRAAVERLDKGAPS